jgi:hypothetical protein
MSHGIRGRSARLAALTLLAALGASPALAQSKVGTTIAQFLGIEPSARTAALGNAAVGLYDGIESVYFNPGALGALDGPSVQFTHAAWFVDISYDYAAVALPLSNWGTLFGSLTSLSSGEIDVRTVERPLGTGERYTVGDLAIGLGFGRQITSRFAAGVQMDYVRERIWHSVQSTVVFNLGTVYQLGFGGIKIGSCISNMGTRSEFSGRDLAIQFDTDPDVFGDNSALPAEQFTDRYPVPIGFRVGVAAPYETSPRSRLLVLLDALHPADNTETVNTGVEWMWNETLALRAGYQTLFQQDSELGWTFGTGLCGDLGEREFRVDYAWANHDHLDSTHRLTLALELDRKPAREQQEGDNQ